MVWHRDVGLIHGEDVFFFLLFPPNVDVTSHILSLSHPTTPATHTTTNTTTAAPQQVRKGKAIVNGPLEKVSLADATTLDDMDDGG